MKMKQFALILSLILASLFAATLSYAATAGSNVSASTETKIEDPYADNQSNSPWTMSMENVQTFGGRVVRGAATLTEGASIDSYTPYFPDKTTALSGYGSSKVSVGCDGINLGGVIDGQLSQYQQMVEQFIQQAPALAVMYLAYSQPTVKAVIDELNGVSQFGLDLTNASCSGVRAIADKAAEEKAQAMAEARCTADAGYKDPECMSDDGLLSSVTKVMKDTKNTVTQRADQYLGKVTNATGGLVSFNTGKSSNSGTNESNRTGSTISNNGVRAKACSNIDSKGLRTMLLASSGIPCEDIENYAALLPDYQISDNGESGVIPRTLTLRKLASDLVVHYEGWINEIAAAKEADFINTDGFKAIYNRTSVAISVQQHRKMNLLMKNNPAQGLAMIRSLSQLIALKDLNFIVSNLEVAVLTGIQNQSDDQVLPQLRKQQYVHAVDSLKAELANLTEEVNMDLKRNEILKAS
jgi:hypothetical protein